MVLLVDLPSKLDFISCYASVTQRPSLENQGMIFKGHVGDGGLGDELDRGSKTKEEEVQAWTKIIRNSEVVVRTFRARQGGPRGWSACVFILDMGLEYMITLLLRGINVGQSILVRDHQQFILGNQFNKPCSRKSRVSNPNIPWSSNYTRSCPLP